MDYVASSENYKQKLFWVAIYKDESRLCQTDGIDSKSIIKKNLKTILLINSNKNVIITQHFKLGQQVIYRIRTAIQEKFGTLERIHILGWQQQNIRHIAFIFESDNHIELGDFIDKNSESNSPWLYPINFNDHDLIQVT